MTAGRLYLEPPGPRARLRSVGGCGEMVQIQYKRSSKRALSLLCLGTFLMLGQTAEARVPFVRQCTGNDIGEWEFGEAANGCDAFRFGNPARIKFVYADFTFDRTKTDVEAERKKYVTNLNGLIGELATRYIRSRKPNVAEDEVEAFALQMRTVAHQETFWSHYRIGRDGKYKMATGDKNVSHGIMQINQKYHASRSEDRSFDLVGNISYGIELSYAKWETALETKCVTRSKKQTRAQTLINASRATYASYNGGPGAICRWTNPKHPWARNDRAFFRKLNAKEWAPWVTEPEKKVTIDLDCARTGDDLCAVAKERREEMITSRPLIMEDGRTCVSTDGKSLDCARDTRVFSCMAGIRSEVLASAPLKVRASDGEIAAMPANDHVDRLGLCNQAFPDMAKLGDLVIPSKDVGMAKDIGGRPFLKIKKGQALQVLDLEVDIDEANAPKFYRVRLAGQQEGWISGTDVQIVNLGFRAPTDALSKTKTWLPAIGRAVEVAKTDGSKLLSKPDSKDIVATLSKGAQAMVEAVEVTGAANEIWLKVKAGDLEGYIYAGRTFPSLSIEQWVKLK